MATWLSYANQGAIRNQPLSQDLMGALSFLPELGVTMEVFSGGQDAKGEGGRRTGSTRHDHGGAADVFFYKDGRRLDWANPDDQPIFAEIVRRAKARGVTGFGAGDGYMQPGSMHIGFGNPAVWGAGGKGANAPDWLLAAYGAAGSAPTDGQYAPREYSAGTPDNNALAALLTGPGSTQDVNSLAEQPEQRRNALAVDPEPFMTRRRAVAPTLNILDFMG